MLSYCYALCPLLSPVRIRSNEKKIILVRVLELVLIYIELLVLVILRTDTIQIDFLQVSSHDRGHQSSFRILVIVQPS